MKNLFLDSEMTYDGSQLTPRYNYLEHGLLGASIVGWIGPCNVDPQFMVDGEDIRIGSEIRGDRMVHYLIELPFSKLKTAVTLQRLMAEMVMGEIKQYNSSSDLVRRGDDIYNGKNEKFNISIATVSSVGSHIHFAFNCIKAGAPVPIVSLECLKIPEKEIALRVLEKVSSEWSEIERASLKVKPI